MCHPYMRVLLHSLISIMNKSPETNFHLETEARKVMLDLKFEAL